MTRVGDIGSIEGDGRRGSADGGVRWWSCQVSKGFARCLNGKVAERWGGGSTTRGVVIRLGEWVVGRIRYWEGSGEAEGCV